MQVFLHKILLFCYCKTVPKVYGALLKSWPLSAFKANSEDVLKDSRPVSAYYVFCVILEYDLCTIQPLPSLIRHFPHSVTSNSVFVPCARKKTNLPGSWFTVFYSWTTTRIYNVFKKN